MEYPETANTKEAREAVFERRKVAVKQSIDEYHGYLQNYLYGLTRQWQDAENLLQDLWQYVLLRFKEDQIGSLPLLRKKAYQLFIDHYRRMVRRGETLSDSPPEPVTRPMTPDAYTDAEEIALKEKFWSEYPGIDLTEEQKEVLWLHARYGFTFAEIEEKTGVSSSTACDWVAHGRDCIAKFINR
ncbi:RNA polymerase sigma factor [Luteolibacter algae]|uniref:RNA polymerase sigma factor n=1 Tax=Luteolibacter algae TaxID=454151 RepID=A0ABW5D9F0_9BACT